MTIIVEVKGCVATLFLLSVSCLWHKPGATLSLPGHGQPLAASTGVVERSDDASPLEATVQQLSSAVTVLQSKVNALTNDLANLRYKVGQAVAFSVRFYADPVNNVGNGATLRFDSVMQNLGDGYKPVTGLFTAPVSGLYVFSLHFMGSDTQQWTQLAITKNGYVMLDVDYTEGNGDLHDQSSGLATTHLAAGEQVWVKHYAGGTSIRGGLFTTFSGFLVHADLS